MSLTPDDAPPRIATPMHLGIDEVLAEVRRLRRPVVRSCHIGNNTANVWGWLAKAGNARLVQYDHTLYGVDGHCLPWAVLGDGGRVDAGYLPDGSIRQRDVGRHANDMLAGMERTHRHRLMHGIFVDHHGEDLLLRHRRIAARLTRQMNGSEPSFDSQEMLQAHELVGAIVRDLARRDALDVLFDRWVRRSRRGHVTARRLDRIEARPGGDIRVVDLDGTIPFEGHVNDLVAQLQRGMEAVVARLVAGRPYTELSYPWVSLPFAYLLDAVVEAAADPTVRVFWHAGGSSSQYYVNEEPFRQASRHLFEILEAGGFLPAGSRLRMIPTFSYQLFALTPEGLAALDDLLGVWHRHLTVNAATASRAVAALATTTDPFTLAEAYTRSLPPGDATRLVEALARFNAADPNTLPIAHAGRRPHASFTKWGIAQHHLIDRLPLFPPSFGQLTGGQAELAVGVLAQLTTATRS